MIDTYHAVFLGVILVFIAITAVIAVVTVVVFTAVYLITLGAKAWGSRRTRTRNTGAYPH